MFSAIRKDGSARSIRTIPPSTVVVRIARERNASVTCESPVLHDVDLSGAVQTRDVTVANMIRRFCLGASRLAPRNIGQDEWV